MDVRLIAMTQPLDFERAEDLIAYCARVSNPDNQMNFDTSEKLLRYCIRQKHWSIFEQVDLSFEIKTTRDIGRQILRHSFDPQEFSQRYAEVNVDDFVIREARMQDKANRQNSLETTNKEIIEGWITWQKKVAGVAANAYKWAISNGLAKEQARAVLPEGMTMSVMYVKGNLRNWIHYVDTRTDMSTQKEHRLIANECKNLIVPHFNFLKDYWNLNNDL